MPAWTWASRSVPNVVSAPRTWLNVSHHPQTPDRILAQFYPMPSEQFANTDFAHCIIQREVGWTDNFPRDLQKSCIPSNLAWFWGYGRRRNCPRLRRICCPPIYADLSQSKARDRHPWLSICWQPKSHCPSQLIRPFFLYWNKGGRPRRHAYLDDSSSGPIFYLAAQIFFLEGV